MFSGCAFSGETESGKKYISIVFDEVVYAIFPFLEKIRFTLWYVPKSERKSDKSPAWRLAISKKEESNRQKNEEPAKNPITDEEVPF